jgi:RND family efflux transporter MFP subunit
MTPHKRSLDELRIDRSGASRTPQWFGQIAVALVLLVGVAGLIWWFSGPQPAEVRTVMVQDPSSGRDETLLNASGYVTARREATVSSKVTGKVKEVLIEEGSQVEEGQVLARLDSANVEKNLNLAQAQLESSRKALEETKVNLRQAERELSRFTRLADEAIASQSELDTAEASANALRARLDRQLADVAVAEQQLALRKQELEDTVIRAPFSGVVTSKNAQPGEMISPMSAGGGFTRTGICTIVDMDSLEIEVDVNESYINRVKAGQPVEATLDAYPDWRIPSKVIAIIPTADRQKATVKVRVGFDQLDPRILPEMSVKVAFQSTGKSSPARQNITIPLAALHRNDGHDIVWVVRDGQVERRAVTVGSRRDSNAAIAAGLTGGERIVVEGPGNLTEGDPVTEPKL